MRKSSSSYPLLSLAGLLLAGSCSIIAEVDRTKIPTDGGPPPEGGQSSGGTSNTGGSSAGKGGTPGTGGTSDTGGTAGASGAGGDGGETGGTGGDAGAGDGGDAGGGMGGAGAGGEGGSGGPICGDGNIDGNEECDDGHAAANGDGCSISCIVEPGWECPGTPSVCVADRCGDRLAVDDEVCDDGNANACGTCSVNCGTATPAAAATGSISPGAAADLADGDTFTLNDGTNPAVVFEFDETPGDGVTGSNVAVVFDPAGTATELQTAIRTAINGVTTAPALAITAANGTAPNVNLTNDVAALAGNQTTAKSIASGTSTFAITNMTGGAANDCTTGTGCASDNDCVTTCNGTSHLCN
jgi:cysteine-rich repeat protein